MIRLTQHEPPRPLWINPAQIVSIYALDSGSGIVPTTGLTIRVNEPPEEVVARIGIRGRRP